MPSSFSRFLNDEELQKVRELYQASLEESTEEDTGTATDKTSESTGD